MADYLIPTSPSVPDYTQRTQLDGKDYNLRFVWNQRLEAWFLDILDEAEAPIVIGLKLVTNYPILRWHQWDLNVPPGELFVIVTGPDDSPPKFDDFGEGLRCVLIYQSKTDL